MMKIVYQGIAGSYSESCAKYLYPSIETIPVKLLMNVLRWQVKIVILGQLYQSQIKQQETLE